MQIKVIIQLFKKQHFILAILLLVGTAGYSQKEFFRSQQVFAKEQMSSFYSFVIIHDSPMPWFVFHEPFAEAVTINKFNAL